MVNGKSSVERAPEKEGKFEVVRRKLTEMRQDLFRESKAEIGQLLNAGDTYTGVFDDGELADIAIRDSLQAVNLTRNRAKLRAVEEALRKIEDGVYGVCEDCEEDIPVGRLNVMPFALRCIDCQEKHEITGLGYEEQGGKMLDFSASRGED